MCKNPRVHKAGKTLPLVWGVELVVEIWTELIMFIKLNDDKPLQHT